MRLKIIDIWARHTSAANTSWIWLNKIPTQHSIGIYVIIIIIITAHIFQRPNAAIYIIAPFLHIIKFTCVNKLAHISYTRPPHTRLFAIKLFMVFFLFAFSLSWCYSTPCQKGIKCMWMRECVGGVGRFRRILNKFHPISIAPKSIGTTTSCAASRRVYFILTYFSGAGVWRRRGAQILLFCTSCTAHNANIYCKNWNVQKKYNEMKNDQQRASRFWWCGVSLKIIRI